MTEAAWYVAQRAWEATQPQLFWTNEVLWPDSGLDERHAPFGPDGQPVVEAAVPLAARVPARRKR